MFCKLVQFENVEFSILATLLGMVKSINLVQPANASEPIEVTLLGILMLVKFVQL